MVASVPMANGTSFSAFFGDLPPSFCIYRAPPGAKEHTRDEVEYMSVIQAHAPGLLGSAL